MSVFFFGSAKNKTYAIDFKFSPKLSLTAEISAHFAFDCILATFPFVVFFL